MSHHNKLPKGWRIVEVMTDSGTGMADDSYGYSLQRYLPITTGFFWFRKTFMGWVTIDQATIGFSPRRSDYQRFFEHAWATHDAEQRLLQ